MSTLANSCFCLVKTMESQFPGMASPQEVMSGEYKNPHPKGTEVHRLQGHHPKEPESNGFQGPQPKAQEIYEFQGHHPNGPEVHGSQSPHPKGPEFHGIQGPQNGGFCSISNGWSFSISRFTGSQNVWSFSISTFTGRKSSLEISKYIFLGSVAKSDPPDPPIRSVSSSQHRRLPRKLKLITNLGQKQFFL